MGPFSRRQVAECRQEGRLLRLLPDYSTSDAGIYAVYQDQHLQQAKIRQFIGFLAAHMRY